MNTNSLDLNTDILNVIGNYVMKDNIIKEENFKRHIFNYVYIRMKIERKMQEKENTINVDVIQDI